MSLKRAYSGYRGYMGCRGYPKVGIPFLVFGCPKYEVLYYSRGPKGDHNFDNHPHIQGPGMRLHRLGA